MGYVKVVQAGKQLRVYQYKYDYVYRRVKRERRAKSLSDIVRHSRRKDNIFRLRGRFYDVVRANLVADEVPVLVSLTMFQVTTVGKAYDLFTRFIQRVRNRIEKKIKYVAVPEFQRRGAVHFHLLVWGFGDNIILNEGSTGREKDGSRRRLAGWLAKKGYGVSEIRNDRNLQRCWRYGYCDITPTDGGRKIAGYLTKYMQKALFSDLFASRKAYVCSRNILRPVSTASATVFSYVREITGGVDPVKVVKYDTPFLGLCTKTVYEL